ncbi:MAG: DUF177 domain-containing protein, partial [Clostridia bacterium]|nr:DUF177 domain-containing protein [Clostridia bacterium]
QTQIQLDKDLVSGKNYQILTPAKVEGTYCYEDDKLNLDAMVSFDVLAYCDNCGEQINKVISFRLTEDFIENSASHSEEDYLILNQTCIELDKPIEDALLLNMPSRLLCKDDCKGLCSICGKNKNTTSCSCQVLKEEMENLDNPFEILKNKQGR